MHIKVQDGCSRCTYVKWETRTKGSVHCLALTKYRVNNMLAKAFAVSKVFTKGMGIYWWSSRLAHPCLCHHIFINAGYSGLKSIPSKDVSEC